MWGSSGRMSAASTVTRYLVVFLKDCDRAPETDQCYSIFDRCYCYVGDCLFSRDRHENWVDRTWRQSMLMDVVFICCRTLLICLWYGRSDGSLTTTYIAYSHISPLNANVQCSFFLHSSSGNLLIYESHFSLCMYGSTRGR